MIVLGCGTGRCGTKSLASFLNKQPNSEVHHEFGKKLRWDKEDWQFFWDRLNVWYRDIEYLSRSIEDEYRLGDVAPWYLPYIEEIVRVYDLDWPFRIICLRRDKDETVESYINHQNQGNTFQNTSPNWPEVDQAYPTYPDELSMEEAVGRYWRDYYECAEWISDQVDWFEIFELEELNRKIGQIKLMDFLELPLDQRAWGFPHQNKGDY